MSVEQTCHVGGTTGQKYIGTAAVAARNGTTNFPGRKWLLIQNKSNVRMSYSVRENAVFKESPEIAKGGQVVLPVSDSVTIYVRAQSASGTNKKVVIMELG